MGRIIMMGTGIGDTKGLMEAELRDRPIHRTCNAKITKVEEGRVSFAEVDADGKDIKQEESA